LGNDESMLPVITISNAVGSDGDTAIFTIQLSQASLGDVSVQYRTIQDGTAVEGSDYFLGFNTLVIPAGQTTAMIDVNLGSNFSTDRDDSNFTLQLSDPVNAVLAGGQPTLTASAVELDDSGATNDRGLFVSDPVILEGDNGTTQAAFEVRLSESSGTTLNFSYATVDGTALSGEDYTAKSGVVSFAPGQTVKTIFVDIEEDSVSETTETFSLIVTPTSAIATGVADAGGIATILDDDESETLPVISLVATQAADGETARFDVILSQSSFADVTVQFRTIQDGTAVEGETYFRNAGTLTIPAGQTVSTISVNLGSDFSTDFDDTNFTLQLSDPQNAVLSGGNPTLTASAVELDNSGTTNDRGLFVSDPVFFEGDSGTTQAVFEIRISEPSATTLNLSYATFDGTARAGEDYVAASGTVSFVPGQTVASVVVDVIGDGTVEMPETFSLVVASNAAIANGVKDAGGIATILDDDSSETLPIISLLQTEGADGEEAFFDVILSEPSFADVTVQYRTLQDGNAVEGETYFRGFATLTIPAGQTVATISVNLGSDFSTDFNDQNFTLQLSDPENAILAGGQPTLTASAVEMDNSGATNDRALFVSDPVILEGSGGTTQAVFEVRLSEPSVSSLSFAYETVDGSAIAGSDYTAKSGTLTFAPGQTVASVAVDINEDTNSEMTEVFSLVLTPNAGIATGVSDSAGIATLLDDDEVNDVPVISVLPTEGADGELAIFDVILSRPSAGEISVQYTTIQDGTGVDGGTYFGTSGTLTIPAGQTVATISVNLGSDFSTDLDDTNFTLQLSDPVGATLAGDQPVVSATAVELDNSGSTNDRGLFVSDPTFEEGNDGVTLYLNLTGQLPTAARFRARIISGAVAR